MIKDNLHGSLKIDNKLVTANINFNKKPFILTQVGHYSGSDIFYDSKDKSSRILLASGTFSDTNILYLKRYINSTLSEKYIAFYGNAAKDVTSINYVQYNDPKYQMQRYVTSITGNRLYSLNNLSSICCGQNGSSFSSTYATKYYFWDGKLDKLDYSIDSSSTILLYSGNYIYTVEGTNVYTTASNKKYIRYICRQYIIDSVNSTASCNIYKRNTTISWNMDIERINDGYITYPVNGVIVNNKLFVTICLTDSSTVDSFNVVYSLNLVTNEVKCEFNQSHCNIVYGKDLFLITGLSLYKYINDKFEYIDEIFKPITQSNIEVLSFYYRSPYINLILNDKNNGIMGIYKLMDNKLYN